VIPRLGTISPWASKATDIVHNCGMAHVKRVERGIAYRINLKTGILGSSIGATKHLSAEQAQAVAALLHDRMTESVLRHPDEAAGLFRTLEARPLETVDVIGAGKAALERPTPTSAWPCRTMKSNTWTQPSPKRAATRPTWN
jgi:phosphoribosylformylglycinamidine synthase